MRARSNGGFGFCNDPCRLCFVRISLGRFQGQSPCSQLELLGAHVSILPDSVEAVIPERREIPLIADLKNVLEKGRLPPELAADLRGRLGCARSLMFSRVGRAHLAPFSDRQYTKIHGTRYPLTTDLRCVFRWRIAVLSEPSPRRISLAPACPVLIYTDATGSGHLGMVLFHAGTEYRANTHLPGRFARSEKQIGEYDADACVFGLCVDAALFPGIPVLL